MRWIVVLAAGAAASMAVGGGTGGRLLGAVVRELARVVV